MSQILFPNPLASQKFPGTGLLIPDRALGFCLLVFSARGQPRECQKDRL